MLNKQLNYFIMKSFKHTISYKLEDDQSMISEGLLTGELPTTIKVKPLVIKKDSITFVINHKHFQFWAWYLPKENYSLIIKSFVNTHPQTKDYTFEFIDCFSPTMFGLK